MSGKIKRVSLYLCNFARGKTTSYVRGMSFNKSDFPIISELSKELCYVLYPLLVARLFLSVE